MRRPSTKLEAGEPRAHIKKADNKPPIFSRIKFWLWSLKNNK